VFSAAYTGSEGHDLFQSRATNLIDPATGKRPLTQFGQFGISTNDANSNFHALQLSLMRSFTHGFLWQTQYQWSHGIADGSIGAGEGIAVENVSCRACDRSSTPSMCAIISLRALSTNCRSARSDAICAAVSQAG